MKKGVVGEKPSKWWYLLPIFLSIIGGVIGYFLLKEKDKKFAERLLVIGIIMVVVWILLSIILVCLTHLYMGGVAPTIEERLPTLDPPVAEETKWFDLKKKVSLPIILLVDENTYQQLETEINQFAQDIKNDVGTEVKIFHQNYRDAKEVKNSLLSIKQESDFGGIILIGEIPIPLVSTEYDITSYAPSASDSYYADLEDIYQYEEKTDVESWWGNVYFYIKQPDVFAAGDIERWIGRITAPVESDNKTQLIKEYLNRNHEYKTGKLNYKNEMLVFLPNDFGCVVPAHTQPAPPPSPSGEDVSDAINVSESSMSPEECSGGAKKNIAETYFFDHNSVNPLVYGQGDNVYLKQMYLSEIKKPYSVVLMNAHGTHIGHSPSVNYNDIKTSNPKSMFFKLVSCAIGAPNRENNIAQWYLFSGEALIVGAHSVVIMAGSVARAGLGLWEMRILAMGGRIYEAYPTTNYQTLLGDPTLKIKKIDADCNLVFSYDFIDFGTVSYPLYVPEEEDKILYIKNMGSEKCIINLFISDPPPDVSFYSVIPEEIQPQEIVTVTLSIKGISDSEMESSEKIISRSGYLKIVSNDPENIVKIPYQGKVKKGYN